MKKPLYILAMFSVFFIASIFVFMNTQIKLEKQTKQIKQYKELSNKYKILKDNWSDSKQMLKKVNAILKFANIATSNIRQTDNEYIIIVEPIALKQSHKLINKLLNENINLISIDIQREKLHISIGLIR